MALCNYWVLALSSGFLVFPCSLRLTLLKGNYVASSMEGVASFDVNGARDVIGVGDLLVLFFVMHDSE